MTTLTRPRLGRDWRLLWTASAVSTVGDGAFIAVLPLLAATMTSDPRLVAGVTAWATLPWLLAALPAGALVDRMDARRAMTSVQLVQGLLVAALAAATMAHAGRLAVLYAVAFAVGLAETMAKVAGQKLVPAVVPAEHLEQANGTQNATMFAALGFVGPLVGSLLFIIATPLPFWVDVATYALSAALVGRIAATTRPATRARRALRREILDGLRWLAGHRLLRTLSLLSGVANFANYLALATLVLFARQRLGLDHLGYGLLLALMATGGIAGSLASRRILARFGARAVVVGTIFSTPTALIAVGLFAHNLLTMAVLASVTAAGASLWNVAAGSLRQRTVPEDILGRVTSVGLLVSWVAQPLGAVAGGLVAGWFGLAAPWLIAGAIRLVAALLALPALRNWP
jgi:MFS family permease